MSKDVKEAVEKNIKIIKEDYPKEKYHTLLNYFESCLDQAKYEVKKINPYTAPEEIENRKNFVDYYESMIKEIKKLLEV